MTKRTKQKCKVPSLKTFGAQDYSGLWHTVSADPDFIHDVPVRIIRERDYRKLLRRASKRKP